jgi:hypothetical protein
VLPNRGPDGSGSPWILTHCGPPFDLHVDTGKIRVVRADEVPREGAGVEAPSFELGAGESRTFRSPITIKLTSLLEDPEQTRIEIRDNFDQNNIDGRCGGGCWGTGGLLIDACADQ